MQASEMSIKLIICIKFSFFFNDDCLDRLGSITRKNIVTDNDSFPSCLHVGLLLHLFSVNGSGVNCSAVSLRLCGERAFAARLGYSSRSRYLLGSDAWMGEVDEVLWKGSWRDGFGVNIRFISSAVEIVRVLRLLIDTVHRHAAGISYQNYPARSVMRRHLNMLVRNPAPIAQILPCTH